VFSKDNMFSIFYFIIVFCNLFCDNYYVLWCCFSCCHGPVSQVKYPDVAILGCWCVRAVLQANGGHGLRTHQMSLLWHSTETSTSTCKCPMVQHSKGLQNWRRVWFNDESRFMVQTRDGCTRVYRRRNARFADVSVLCYRLMVDTTDIDFEVTSSKRYGL
jgi:hypothetical protein